MATSSPAGQSQRRKAQFPESTVPGGQYRRDAPEGPCPEGPRPEDSAGDSAAAVAARLVSAVGLAGQPLASEVMSAPRLLSRSAMLACPRSIR